MTPRLRRLLAIITTALAALLFLPYVGQMLRPLPQGLDFAGKRHGADEIAFLHDLTWVDADGIRHTQQQIFDAMLEIVRGARRFIVLDMFLYNAWVGKGGDPERHLSAELTDALVAQKRAWPGLSIIVITDPINTVYGGAHFDQFDRLREQGIDVVTTRLEALRDSNPVYSLFWRVFVRPFGNSVRGWLPNPFGPGHVSLRSYLSLLNFKANHRKTLLADRGDGLVGLVTSANPHDGSSANTNIAVLFDGPAVLDLLETENAVLEFSGAQRFDPGATASRTSQSSATVQVLTEHSIEEAVIEAIERAGEGDRLRLGMFYLSDRDVIRALKSARARGVALSVLLDPNRDAFGRTKNGVPARPVAHELRGADIPIRWCDTHGEQCHLKMLLVDYRDGTSVLIAGSANFTRRNLENFNLETNVAVHGPRETPAIADARAFFERMWTNDLGRRVTVDYDVYAESSMFKRMLYRFAEGSGVSTF